MDRFLAKDYWLDFFPKAYAFNYGFFDSDHRVVKMILNHRKWVKKGVRVKENKNSRKVDS